MMSGNFERDFNDGVFVSIRFDVQIVFEKYSKRIPTMIILVFRLWKRICNLNGYYLAILAETILYYIDF